VKTMCVAHLVRASNGPEPLRRFLASYRRHAAGVPHRLLIIFKGFRGRTPGPEYESVLGEVPHERLFLRDFGFDIRPYFVAARKTRFDFYCFLNSFSVILDDGWLAKLAKHMGDEARDLVGATGSWISHQTVMLNDPDVGKYLQVGARKVRLPPLLSSVARVKWLGDARRHFEPFPNAHMRTTCFLVSRHSFLECAPGQLLLKIDALKFESGRSGLSARFKASGGRLLVVGRDGKCYPEREWAASNTFWHRDQENLLVADNQTSMYHSGDAATRARLSALAWGNEARPSAPAAPGRAPARNGATR